MTRYRPIDYAQRFRAQRTALVVDDVEDMLDLLEIALNASNFNVLRASNAQEAFELFRTHAADIDLLMTDVRVGTDSGLELARRLLALKPDLQVLATSGFSIDGKVVSGQSRIEFLPKPFSTSELRSKLHSIFNAAPVRLTVTVSAGQAGTYTISTTCSAPEPPSFPGTGFARSRQ
jgi:DNA-binding response OmpR family regulator